MGRSLIENQKTLKDAGYSRLACERLTVFVHKNRDILNEIFNISIRSSSNRAVSNDDLMQTKGICSIADVFEVMASTGGKFIEARAEKNRHPKEGDG